jgi:ABC-type antimicrobial peptide transport system permease subunit
LGITDKGSLLVRSRHAFPIGGTFSVLPYMDNNTGFQSNTIIELGADSRYIDEFIIVPEDGEYDRLFTEIEDVMQRINPEPVKPTVVNLRKKLTGELFLLDNMQNGAWILSAICFVICFMGIWSSISLDTRSRQKEVAVRKVHGAKRKDIVLLFGRLYLWLIGVASVLCIPLVILFNILLQEWGESQKIPSELVSPVVPIAMSIAVVSFVIAIVVGVHIRKVMKLQPADIISKE